MNSKQGWFMFSKSEIKALRDVSMGKVTISGLHNRLSMSPSGVSAVVKKLQRKSMVTTKRAGMKKFVEMNDAKHAVLFKELLQKYQHIPWEDLLADSSILVLLQIFDSKTRKFEGRISKRTVFRRLSSLTMHGIIKESEDGYMINSRYEPLIEFLREYQSYIVREKVESVVEDSVILWQKDFECLIRTKSEVKRDYFFRTGISCFADYGIKLITNYMYYFYSEKKKRLRKEDVVLHALLAERDSVRNITYCLIFLKKFEQMLDESVLLTEAENFDIGGLVEQMLGFLRNRKRDADVMLPSWGEFVEKAREYGVI
ncbi:MAG: hypothetical protein JW815_02120 [Candidatus Bathyarchaeota archaeon]|nr:hypothetical protein [Candidatus Bathyarchaeum sp.]